jgi:hypothetical protein
MNLGSSSPQIPVHFDDIDGAKGLIAGISSVCVCVPPFQSARHELCVWARIMELT